MRFKLANGRCKASTNQPIQNKNFDRLKILDDYNSYLAEHGTFTDGGIPADGDIEFEVALYNPSTHLIQKSYHSAGIRMSLGPRSLSAMTGGSVGGSYSNRNPYIKAQNNIIKLNFLNHGQTRYVYFNPSIVFIHENHTHTVNPFCIDSEYSNWKVDGRSPTIHDYEHNYWSQPYLVKLMLKTGGGGHGNWKVLQKYTHNIKYKIR